MTTQINPATRRVVRATIEDGQRSSEGMADAVEDLLAVGIEPMELLRTLESLDDVAQPGLTRIRARSAIAAIRDQMRDAIRGTDVDHAGL